MKPLHAALVFAGLGAALVAGGAAYVLSLQPAGQIEGTVATPALSGAVSAPRLSLPREQPCLSGPSEVDEGEEMGVAASAGLDVDQVQGTMRGFLPKALDCFRDAPSGTLSVELNVACSGRVTSAQVLDDGGLDDSVARCVTERLAYAPFPAHDMPDGFSFEYPIRYTAP
ncbi:MAG: hypothetical protein FJ102_00020 [Deltaproteobacteria bacterium]|nr:hypothetical protein [Deltaproteobacteria bacterium]